MWNKFPSNEKYLVDVAIASLKVKHSAPISAALENRDMPKNLRMKTMKEMRKIQLYSNLDNLSELFMKSRLKKHKFLQQRSF